MDDEVKAILHDWPVVRVEDRGAFWLIAGKDADANSHSGTRADPIALAHDLYARSRPPVALESPAVEPALEPVELDPPPAPADPQPVEPVAVSAPPLSDALHVESGGVAPDEAPPGERVDAPAHVSAYAGTMLQEDRENYLRGQITVRVTMIEENRLAGRFDINAQERQRWGFTEYHNRSAQELPIPDDVQAAYAEFMEADQWVRATKTHADNLRRAAITVPLNMLEAMVTQIEEGWP